MSEWISVKKELPPLNIYVEVIYPPKSRMSDIFRGIAALRKGNEIEGLFWCSLYSDETEDGKYGITHWKKMCPDHLGRIPKLIVSKNGFFKVKLVKDE